MKVRALTENPIQGFPAELGGVGGKNVRVWGALENGAEIIDYWEGEEDVALLGYDLPSYANVKSATFTTSVDIGPTASCMGSPGNLETTDEIYTEYYFVEDTHETPPDSNQNAVDLGRQLQASGAVGEHKKKPSEIQIVVGVWFEFDGPLLGMKIPEDPVPEGTEQAVWSGVAQTGVGQGDLIWFEDLRTGQTAWLFTKQNEITSVPEDSYDPYDLTQGPPMSTSWEGAQSGERPKVMWYEMTVEAKPVIKLSIVPPSWGRGNFGSPRPIKGAPYSIRYYVALYVLGQGRTPGSGGNVILGTARHRVRPMNLRK